MRRGIGRSDARSLFRSALPSRRGPVSSLLQEVARGFEKDCAHSQVGSARRESIGWEQGAEIECDLHTLALQLDSLDQRAARDTT